MDDRDTQREREERKWRQRRDQLDEDLRVYTLLLLIFGGTILFKLAVTGAL